MVSSLDKLLSYFHIPSGSLKDAHSFRLYDISLNGGSVKPFQGLSILSTVLVLGSFSYGNGGTSIRGEIIDGQTGYPVPSATVTLQRAEMVGRALVYRIVMSTTADASGSFLFSPVRQGSYLLVAVAQWPAVRGCGYRECWFTSISRTYAPTVVTFVWAGSNVEQLPLFDDYALRGDLTVKYATGTIEAGASATEMNITALQRFTCPPWLNCPQVPIFVTMPAVSFGNVVRTRSSYYPVPNISIFSTAAKKSCSPGVTCGTYALAIPGQKMTVRQSPYRSSQIYRPTGPPTYVVSAQATAPGTTIPKCRPASLTSAAITLDPNTPEVSWPHLDAAVKLPQIAFSGCN
jgi:hypothetical protein